MKKLLLSLIFFLGMGFAVSPAADAPLYDVAALTANVIGQLEARIKAVAGELSASFSIKESLESGFDSCITKLQEAGATPDAMKAWIMQAADDLITKLSEDGGNGVATFVDRALGGASTAATGHSETFLKKMNKNLEKAFEELTKNLRKSFDKNGKFVGDRLAKGNEALAKMLERHAWVVGKFTLPAIALVATLPVSYYGMKFAYEQVTALFADKPSIMKDTNISNRYRSFWNKTTRLVGFKEEKYPLIRDVELHPTIRTAGLSIAKTISNIRDNKGVYRNVLLWGAPGTGKTMFAQAVANQVDCYWIVMTGSSIFKLPKSEALIEIDRLFDWIKAADKPVLLIVDEAEYLFMSRNNNLSEETRSVLVHLMSYLGTESNKFIIMALTNRPEDIDEAILTRFPDQIEFTLPTYDERCGIIKRNITRLITEANVEVADANLFDDATIAWMAQVTENMAGREIMYMVAGIAAATDASEQGILTREVLKSSIEKTLETLKAQKDGFQRTKKKDKVGASQEHAVDKSVAVTA